MNGEMKFTRFAVSLAGETWEKGRKRATRRPQTNYLTSASFKAGDGMKINRFTFSADRAKAFAFAKFTAEAIAKQLTDGSFGKRYFDVKVEPLVQEG
jgi:hypothetical protein